MAIFAKVITKNFGFANRTELTTKGVFKRLRCVAKFMLCCQSVNDLNYDNY